MNDNVSVGNLRIRPDCPRRWSALDATAQDSFESPNKRLLTAPPRSSPVTNPGASSAEEEKASAEAAEEHLQRALEAIDTGLVTFSSDEGAPVRARGAVPYYRLHKVVAAAVTRKAFILVSDKGSLCGHFT